MRRLIGGILAVCLLYSGLHARPANASQEESVLFFAVGDIMLSRSVASKMYERGAGYPFEKVKKIFSSGDLIFGNFENPIIEGRKIKPLEMSFRADSGVENELKKTGFSILSLANNHSMNFGQSGIVSTLKLLQEAGIQGAGAGKSDSESYAPRYSEKNGIRFAFLAYTDPRVVPKSYQAAAEKPGVAFLDMKKMKQGIRFSKRNADVVIVSFHFGDEYTRKPNKTQREYARAAIDFGADGVIGHHPHVLQTLELYKGKPIVYSLGNFVFDQMWSMPTRESAIMKAEISKRGFEKIDFIPIRIYDYAQPRFVKQEKERQQILEHLGAYSFPLTLNTKSSLPTTLPDR